MPSPDLAQGRATARRRQGPVLKTGRPVWGHRACALLPPHPGGTSEASCKPCPAGSFCPGQGLCPPTGPCAAGPKRPSDPAACGPAALPCPQVPPGGHRRDPRPTGLRLALSAWRGLNTLSARTRFFPTRPAPPHCQPEGGTLPNPPDPQAPQPHTAQLSEVPLCIHCPGSLLPARGCLACPVPPRGVPALPGCGHLPAMSTWLLLPTSRHQSAQTLPGTRLLPSRYAQEPSTLPLVPPGPPPSSSIPSSPTHSNSMGAHCRPGAVPVPRTPAWMGELLTATHAPLPPPGWATPPCCFASLHLLGITPSALSSPYTQPGGAQGERLHHRGWYTGIVTCEGLGVTLSPAWRRAVPRCRALGKGSSAMCHCPGL